MFLAPSSSYFAGVMYETICNLSHEDGLAGNERALARLHNSHFLRACHSIFSQRPNLEFALLVRGAFLASVLVEISFVYLLAETHVVYPALP